MPWASPHLRPAPDDPKQIKPQIGTRQVCYLIIDQHASLPRRRAFLKRKGNQLNFGSIRKTALCTAIRFSASWTKTEGASSSLNRLAMDGYWMRPGAKSDNASGKQSIDTREPRIVTSLPMKSARQGYPQTLLHQPQYDDPPPPAATRSIVYSMAEDAPVASITTGVASPPVRSSTRASSLLPPASGMAPGCAAIPSRSVDRSVA